MEVEGSWGCLGSSRGLRRPMNQALLNLKSRKDLCNLLWEVSSEEVCVVLLASGRGPPLLWTQCDVMIRWGVLFKSLINGGGRDGLSAQTLFAFAEALLCSGEGALLRGSAPSSHRPQITDAAVTTAHFYLRHNGADHDQFSQVHWSRPLHYV